MSHQYFSVSKFIGGVFQDEVLAVFLEILFTLPFDKGIVAIDILLDFEELFYELYERSAIDVAQFTNQYGVEYT